jgi:hypothetical protein
MVEGRSSLAEPAEAGPVAPVTEGAPADDHRRGAAVGRACHVAKLRHAAAVHRPHDLVAVEHGA